MDENNKIQLFEDKRIRMAWDEEAEEWYFSMYDSHFCHDHSANPKLTMSTLN